MDIHQFKDTLGILGNLITIATLVPQIIKMWKTKSVNDISIVTLIIQLLNVSVWLAYGILQSILPLVIVNIFMFTNSAIMISLKIKYSGKTVG